MNNRLSDGQIAEIYRMFNHKSYYYNLPDDDGVYHKTLLIGKIAKKIGCTSKTVMKYADDRYRQSETKYHRKYMATDSGRASKRKSEEMWHMVRGCALYPRELNLDILESKKGYYIRFFNKAFGARIPVKGPRYNFRTKSSVRARDSLLESYDHASFKLIGYNERLIFDEKRPKKMPAVSSKYYVKYDASERGKERTAMWSFIERSSIMPKNLTLSNLGRSKDSWTKFLNRAFDAGLPDHIKGPRYNGDTDQAVISRDYRLDNYVNARLGVAGVNESLMSRKPSRYNERTKPSVKMVDSRLERYVYARFGAAADSERLVFGADVNGG